MDIPWHLPVRQTGQTGHDPCDPCHARTLWRTNPKVIHSVGRPQNLKYGEDQKKGLQYPSRPVEFRHGGDGIRARRETLRPTLDFKSKQLVYAHYLTVPSRTLEPDATKSLPPRKRGALPPQGQQSSLEGNLIIHSDNLHALKALMPRYAGRIAKQANQKKKTAVVFAMHKFMGQKELIDMGIVFCGLPYDTVRSMT